MKFVKQITFLLLAVFCVAIINAQNFTPVPVTGFNQDCIAEAGPSSLATTTKELDDPVASNKVMYSENFRTFAGFSGGGLPNSGTITSGSMTFQLGDYTTNNALFNYKGQNGSLTLTTPTSFSKLRVLCFSTEANVVTGSMVTISVTFMDGTTTSYISNYNLSDWFNGTTNTVISGFGRCNRVAAAPWGLDGLPSNPRMYYIEIVLNCIDVQKQVQKINFTNSTTAGSSSIFPNQVFLAVSGASFSQTITTSSTPSQCASANTGTATVNVSGSSSPYTYSWNTVPVQTSATATGLIPGTYTCTITDANNCSTTQQVTVAANSAPAAPTATGATICSGNTANLSITNPQAGFVYSWYANATGGTALATGTSYTTLPLTANTTYYVDVTNSFGCVSATRTAISVNINALPTAPAASGATICSGNTATLSITNPQTGSIYNWFANATGGTMISVGTNFTTPPLIATTTYYVEVTNASGCTSATRTATTAIVNPLPTAPTVNGATICTGTNTTLNVTNPQTGFVYNWYNASSGGTLLFTGTSFTLNNVTSITTVYVQTTNSQGCISASRVAVTVDLYIQLSVPVVTATNVTTNSITFSWTSVSGATGYEVSTNGGVSFQTPSSGITGTSHVLTGLNPFQTVSIIVRALGAPACRNSLLSTIVSATTLGTREVFVPNVFTPNGDGKNDVLLVYGNYITSMNLKIFNQWGELIFITTNKNFGWNGIYKNKMQPVGVYAYILVAVLDDGTTVNKHGAINLVL